MSESATPEHGNNALKRKNEDLNNDVEDSENPTSHNKRIALDSEQLEKEEASSEVIGSKVKHLVKPGAV